MSVLPFEQFLVQALKRNKVQQAHKEVLERGVEMVRRCYNEGIYVLFTDGLRTGIDQAVLYGKGRTSSTNPKTTTIYRGIDYANPKVGKVTNAKPFESMHNYGLALDFVLTDGQAKTVTYKRTKEWERAAAIAKELGFVWGGDWKGFVDNPHIEYNGGLTIAQIKIGQFPTFKPYKETKEDDDIMKFSDPTTEKQIREFITQAVDNAYIDRSWLVKLNNKTITNGDVTALQMIVNNKKK